MILLFFSISLIAALFITPQVKKISWHFNLFDEPSVRKIHKKSIPRIGGVAIFLSFFCPFFLLSMLYENIDMNNFVNQPIVFFVGALLIFLIGLIDDIKSISFKLKFVGQIAVAFFMYFNGFAIRIITNPFGVDINLDFFSFPITIFWFLLLINSINLIDGLDGLAAGICLFASLSMLIIYMNSNQLIQFASFASLSGALIGFLRYNFNPASIFMGDSGSYFLGYCLAALSISSTIKGQVATALLIPIIILGVPIFDTLWAPIRRFVVGQEMFQPDKGHIHHRLMMLGYTHRRAVLLLYLVTFFLGICAFVLVHTKNNTSAFILFFLGVGCAALVHHLKLSNFFTIRKVSSLTKTIARDIDFGIENRSFLNNQFNLLRSKNLDSLWMEMRTSFSILEIDYAEFIFEYKNELSSKNRKFRFQWNDYKELFLDDDVVFKINLPINVNVIGNLFIIAKSNREKKEVLVLKRIGILFFNIKSILMKIDFED